MWRSDQNNIPIDDSDDEVIKPSSSSRKKIRLRQNTGIRNNSSNDNNEILKPSNKLNDRKVIMNEEILQRKRPTINHRLQTYGEREQYLPQIEWKRALFIALCQGNVPIIENIINEHPRAVNQRIFDMGFEIGLGGAMKFLDCSAPLHVACWNGQAAATRWLLNHGASPTMKDGLNQSPVEIARTNEIKQILGAAKGIITLDDKLSRVEFQAAHTVKEMGSKLHTQLHRVFAQLGSIENDIEVSARRHCKEEIKYLQSDMREEMKDDLLDFRTQLLKKVNEENASKEITKLEKKLKSTNGKLKAIEKYVKELTHENDLRIKDIEHEQEQLLKAKLSNKGKHYDSDDSAAEVEASAGGAYNGGNDLRLQRAVGKLESRIKSLERKIRNIEHPGEKLDELHERLHVLERKKKSGFCVVM
eukprot:g2608.t1